MKRLRFIPVIVLLLALVPAPPVAAARVAGGDATVPASMVLIAGMLGDKHAYGCGVIVGLTPSGVSILTAKHNLAIEDPAYITVVGERLLVTTIAPVEGHDLAVLTAKRPTRAFAVATFAPPSALGTHFRFWGPIENEAFTAHDGTKREIDARVTNTPDEAFAIACARCDHGDSGTGVFDDDNRLVGIVTSGFFLHGEKLFTLAEGYQPRTAVARATGE